MSLVTLAAEKKLPLFQYIDKETIDWIERNKPVFTQSAKLTVELNVIHQFRIKNEWFLEKSIINSIHGYRHMMRCGIYSKYLSILNNLNKNEEKIIIVASVLHDIRRENDKSDAEHGLRTSEWFVKNANEIAEQFNIDLSEIEIEKIKKMVMLHDIDYYNMTPEQQKVYEGDNKLINLIKASDALDRYRLPKLNWWFDQSYIKTSIPDWLRQKAFEYILISEKAFLSNNDNWASIKLLLV